MLARRWIICADVGALQSTFHVKVNRSTAHFSKSSFNSHHYQVSNGQLIPSSSDNSGSSSSSCKGWSPACSQEGPQRARTNSCEKGKAEPPCRTAGINPAPMAPGQSLCSSLLQPHTPSKPRALMRTEAPSPVLQGAAFGSGLEKLEFNLSQGFAPQFC